MNPSSIESMVRKNLSEEDKIKKRFLEKKRKKYYFKFFMAEEQKKKFRQMSLENQIKGKFSEDVAYNAFKMDGWNVGRFFEVYEVEERGLSMFKKVVRYFERKFKINSRKPQYQSRFNEGEILKILNGFNEKEKLLSLLMDMNLLGMMLPDFLLEKEGRIVFLEVKNNKEFFSEDFRQKESMNLLGKKGYKCKVVNLKYSYEDTLCKNVDEESLLFSKEIENLLKD